MKRFLPVLLCMALCSVSLDAQRRARDDDGGRQRIEWKTAGISVLLPEGVEVKASNTQMFTAVGPGIDFRMRTIEDIGHTFFEAMFERIARIDADMEQDIPPVPGRVPDSFFEYLGERGYDPAGHSREVFFPVDYSVVGYMTECEDAEDKLLVLVLYSRARQIPFIVIARFDEDKGRTVGEMLYRMRGVEVEK